MQVAGDRSSTKRLVVVADNSLIVEAIMIGLRKSGEFKLLGQVNARTGSIRSVVEAEPDAVLVDDLERSSQAIDLVREIHAARDEIAVIVLTMSMDSDWLDAVFAAGALGVIFEGDSSCRARHARARNDQRKRPACPEGLWRLAGVSNRRGCSGGISIDHARARGPAARRCWFDERRDRTQAVGDRADRQVPPFERVSEVERRESNRGQSLRACKRPAKHGPAIDRVLTPGLANRASQHKRPLPSAWRLASRRSTGPPSLGACGRCQDREPAEGRSLLQRDTGLGLTRMNEQQPPQSRATRRWSARDHQPRLSSGELVPHAVVTQISKVFSGTRACLDGHANIYRCPENARRAIGQR